MPSNIDLDRFFSQRPEFPNPNISEIRNLSTFIDSYPNEDLRDNFRKLGSDFRYYRAIRGDGNCFYRAVMFQYLRDAKIQPFHELFPNANIFICENLPFQIRGMVPSSDLLLYVWQKYLLPLRDFNKQRRQKELEHILNQSINLDACLIAYFRALNHSFISSRPQFRQYSANINEDLNRIRTFGQQSELIELNALAMILNSQITVYMVDSDRYMQINLNDERSHDKNFVVSYRPGHYDIPIKEQLSSSYRKNQQRISTPEVVSINDAKQMQRFSFRKSEGNQRGNFGHQKTLKTPMNVSNFRKSTEESRVSRDVSRNSQQSSNTPLTNISMKKEEKEKVDPQINPKKQVTKISKANLIRQKQSVKSQRMVVEACFAVFGITILFTALFVL